MTTIKDDASESPNDRKLSDRRSWRALCAVGVALLVGMEAQGMTAEPVRCSAWLDVADEVTECADSTTDNLNALLLAARIKSFWVDVCHGISERGKFVLVANVGAESLSSCVQSPHAIVVIKALAGGGISNHETPLPIRENGEQIAPAGGPLGSAGILSGFFVVPGVPISGFPLAAAVEQMNNDPSGNNDERGDYAGGERRFWRAYINVMPLTVILFWLACYLCYRHGRWVERGSLSNRSDR